MAKTILVVDDEPKIVRLVRAYLEKAGFKAIGAHDGRQALTLFQTEQPALIVLDLMLPDMDGLDVARRMRQSSSTPIIMLTARSEEADRVSGLELGADDYVVKPFNPRELVARVRAVLRRAEGTPSPSHIEIGELTIDLDSHEVLRAGEELRLTPIEFELISTLARQPGRAFTRAQLLDVLYGTTYATTERAVDTHIKNLRRKLEPDPQKPEYILTVHGVGYKFRRDKR